MSDPVPPVTPSRSLFLGATGVLLLSIPFFVFGLAFLDTKARIVLQCERGGTCTVTRAGWLTEQVAGIFTRSEILGARVERSRADRGDQENIYRPVLVTTREEIPLSYNWMAEEKQASRVVKAIERFRQNPESPGFTMWHDDRPRAGRMGLIFTITAGLVLLFGLFLMWRAVKRRREERAQGTAPGA